MKNINLITASVLITLIFSCTKEQVQNPRNSNASYDEIESEHRLSDTEYVIMEEEEKPETDPIGDDDDEYVLMEEVIDLSKSPVTNVQVTLTGQGISLTKLTDENGECSFNPDEGGDYSLQISYQGTIYLTTVVTLELDSLFRKDILPF